MGAGLALLAGGAQWTVPRGAGSTTLSPGPPSSDLVLRVSWVGPTFLRGPSGSRGSCTPSLGAPSAPPPTCLFTCFLGPRESGRGRGAWDSLGSRWVWSQQGKATPRVPRGAHLHVGERHSSEDLASKSGTAWGGGVPGPLKAV